MDPWVLITMYSPFAERAPTSARISERMSLHLGIPGDRVAVDHRHVVYSKNQLEVGERAIPVRAEFRLYGDFNPKQAFSFPDKLESVIAEELGEDARLYPVEITQAVG